ncbi:MAG: hypothetical protein AVDCRST_MAG22-329, partial [uncultured Rubrobacteraceae bacterium]
AATDNDRSAGGLRDGAAPDPVPHARRRPGTSRRRKGVDGRSAPVDAVAKGTQNGRGLRGQRARGAGPLSGEDRAPDAPLPEGDRDARRQQRAAPHRLGGADVRDRLLVPHPFLGTGLRDRGGPRYSGLRLRRSRGEARGDPVRPPEPPERQGRRTRRFPPGGRDAQLRRRHGWHRPQHASLLRDTSGPGRAPPV